MLEGGASGAMAPHEEEQNIFFSSLQEFLFLFLTWGVKKGVRQNDAPRGRQNCEPRGRESGVPRGGASKWRPQGGAKKASPGGDKTAFPRGGGAKTASPVGGVKNWGEKFGGGELTHTHTHTDLQSSAFLVYIAKVPKRYCGISGREIWSLRDIAIYQ